MPVDTFAADAKTSSALQWRLSPRVDRVLTFVAQGIGLVAAFVSMMLCGRAGELAWPGTGPFLGWLVWFLLAYAVIVLHELGHLLAGRVMGMQAVAGYCGPFQMMVQRRGFRWRWRWQKWQKHVPRAAVHVLPDPAKPFAPQFLWLAAGGPLLNLVVGGAFVWIAARMVDSPWVGFAYGFGLFNLGIGAGNLVPFSGLMGSDGLKILRALRLDEQDPLLAFARLNALAMTGITADRLPREQLDLLGRQGKPEALAQVWFQVKGLQNEARWSEAAALSTGLEGRVESLTEPERVALRELLALIECELRFSALLAGDRATPSPVDALNTESDWLVPALRPRCLAALAAVEGNAVEARLWLSRSEACASNSADAAHRLSEGRMRAAVEALLQHDR